MANCAKRIRPPILVLLPLPLCILLAALPEVGAQTIWSGYTKSFSKADFVDPTLAANQDPITGNVLFTRDSSQGLVNAKSECSGGFCSYMHNFSPSDTAWATNLVAGDVNATIAASNWQQLQFTDWEAAYAGNVGNTIVGLNAVVHLITDNIYLDIRFTSWTIHGQGGGFSYLRAEPPATPTPTGDYNGNGLVDAADYALWRKTFGLQANPHGSGADGDSSGMIDGGDYTFWLQQFGVSVNGGMATVVPEPASMSLLFVGLLAAGLCRGRSKWPPIEG